MNGKWAWIILGSLIVLGAIDRLHLLLVFGFTWTGTDEVIFWEMARDYGRGIFHEPYLYAQNYNPALEALLGGPFVAAGLAPWIVLPIVTSLLALIPFWSFAIWHQRKGHWAAACAFAAMPLLLPVEHGLLTTITRGFVQGVVLLALLPWTMAITVAWRRDLLSSFVAYGALFLNPNALVFVVAIAAVMLYDGARRVSFWSWSLAGALPVAAAWWAAHSFYENYPGAIRHAILDWELQFHPELIGLGLSRLDAHFHGLSPVWWPNGHVVLWSLVLAAFILWRKRVRPHAVGVLVALFVMIIALGFYKVHDGVDSIFFSRARMFLAAPLLLAWAAAEALLTARNATRVIVPLAAVSLCAFTVKQLTLQGNVHHHVTDQHGSHVREVPVAALRSACRSIADLAHEHGAEIIVPLRWPDMHQDPEAHFKAYFQCYACSFLADDLPPTLGPEFDRRHWVVAADRGEPAATVMMLGGDPVAWAAAMRDRPDIQRIAHLDLLVHIIRHNTKPVEELVVELDVGRWK